MNAESKPLQLNPYRYLPSDPALTPLRDTAIYPSINRREYATRLLLRFS